MTAAGEGRALRRLLTLVSAVVLVDTVFFAVVTPLLPQYAADLHLSRAGAGVLTGAYPLGTFAGAVPSGVLAARAGARTAILAGLGLLGASSVAFGFLHPPALLDLARFAQGLGGACTWAGGLSWLAEAAPPERRGELIGRALGSAIAGEFLGPAVGALAVATSTKLVFSSVVILAAGLAVWTLRTPLVVRAPEAAGVALGAVGGVLRRPAVLRGVALGTVAATCFGVVTVLVPLRMAGFGAGAGLIGIAFAAGALVEGSVSALGGRYSDRHGRFSAARPALLVTAGLLPLLVLPARPFLLVPILLAITVTLGTFWAPAMAELADVSEAARIPQAYAFALANLAWAAGQTAGSAGGGALAGATRDVVPLALAGLCCLGVFGMLNGSVQREGRGGGARTRQA